MILLSITMILLGVGCLRFSINYNGVFIGLVCILLGVLAFYL